MCTDVEGSTAMWEWNSAVMQVRAPPLPPTRVHACRVRAHTQPHMHAPRRMHITLPAALAGGRSLSAPTSARPTILASGW